MESETKRTSVTSVNKIILKASELGVNRLTIIFVHLQVWFQNCRSRWRRCELKNKHQQTQDAASGIPPAPVFPPFPRLQDNTVTSWSFPAHFSLSVATALALKCKASDNSSCSVTGQSTKRYGSVILAYGACARSASGSENRVFLRHHSSS